MVQGASTAISGSDAMPQYTMISTNPAETIEFPGADAASALYVANYRRFAEADVYEGDRYIFTLRRSGAIGACWTVLTRDDASLPLPRN